MKSFEEFIVENEDLPLDKEDIQNRGEAPTRPIKKSKPVEIIKQNPRIKENLRSRVKRNLGLNPQAQNILKSNKFLSQKFDTNDDFADNFSSNDTFRDYFQNLDVSNIDTENNNDFSKHSTIVKNIISNQTKGVTQETLKNIADKHLKLSNRPSSEGYDYYSDLTSSKYDGLDYSDIELFDKLFPIDEGEGVWDWGNGGSPTGLLNLQNTDETELIKRTDILKRLDDMLWRVGGEMGDSSTIKEQINLKENLKKLYNDNENFGNLLDNSEFKDQIEELITNTSNGDLNENWLEWDMSDMREFTEFQMPDEDAYKLMSTIHRFIKETDQESPDALKFMLSRIFFNDAYFQPYESDTRQKYLDDETLTAALASDYNGEIDEDSMREFFDSNNIIFDENRLNFDFEFYQGNAEEDDLVDSYYDLAVNFQHMNASDGISQYASLFNDYVSKAELKAREEDNRNRIEQEGASEEGEVSDELYSPDELTGEESSADSSIPRKYKAQIHPDDHTNFKTITHDNPNAFGTHRYPTLDNDLEKAGLKRSDLKKSVYIAWELSKTKKSEEKIQKKYKNRVGENAKYFGKDYQLFKKKVEALNAVKNWKQNVLPKLEPGTILYNTPIEGGAGGNVREILYSKMGFGENGPYGQQAVVGKDGKVYPIGPSPERKGANVQAQQRRQQNESMKELMEWWIMFPGLTHDEISDVLSVF